MLVFSVGYLPWWSNDNRFEGGRPSMVSNFSKYCCGFDSMFGLFGHARGDEFDTAQRWSGDPTTIRLLSGFVWPLMNAGLNTICAVFHKRFSMKRQHHIVSAVTFADNDRMMKWKNSENSDEILKKKKPFKKLPIINSHPNGKQFLGKRERDSAHPKKTADFSQIWNASQFYSRNEMKHNERDIAFEMAFRKNGKCLFKNNEKLNETTRSNKKLTRENWIEIEKRGKKRERKTKKLRKITKRQKRKI